MSQELIQAFDAWRARIGQIVEYAVRLEALVGKRPAPGVPRPRTIRPWHATGRIVGVDMSWGKIRVQVESLVDGARMWINADKITRTLPEPEPPAEL
jgi:hypothetical protein